MGRSGNKRGQFEISFKPSNGGKNGGLGPERSFIATLSKGSSSEAQKKLRTPGIIVSIRRLGKRD